MGAKGQGEDEDPRTAGSGGELGAALAAAGGEDRAAGAGAHAQPEAVCLGPAPVVGLEGPLAHGVTPRSVGSAHGPDAGARRGEGDAGRRTRLSSRQVCPRYGAGQDRVNWAGPRCTPHRSLPAVADDYSKSDLRPGDADPGQQAMVLSAGPWSVARHAVLPTRQPEHGVGRSSARLATDGQLSCTGCG